MASILKVDDLRGNTSAGDITITSEGGAATQSLQQGLLKYWMHCSVSGGVPTLEDSLNCSSITDTSAGRIGVTYSSNMSNALYSASGSGVANRVASVDTSSVATTGFTTAYYAASSGSANDSVYSLYSNAGDLA